MLTTSLRLCRKYGACGADHDPPDEQYGLLVKALGPKWGDTKDIPLVMLLDLNAGPDWTALSNTTWALRAVPKKQAKERDYIARIFACWCAEKVLPIYEVQYPKDNRPRQTIETARRYAEGRATAEELAVARAAAGTAACDASRVAAWATAWTTAWAASCAASCSAARAAAWTAVLAASRDVSLVASGDVAGAGPEEMLRELLAA
jgi:hypothetical protein